MSNLARFSISIEKALLGRFERLVRESRYANRSEFVRDLIRDKLAEQEWRENGEVVATITLVYDHEKRDLNNRLTRLQHRHLGLILASTHIHLDKHMCVEMILAKGPASEIREVANLMRRQKGVLHAALSTSSTGHRLA